MLNLEQYLNNLKELVNIDSGTYDKTGVNKVADWFEQRFKNLGYTVKTYNDTETHPYGRSLLFTKEDYDSYDLLVLCHMDTVFPEGEAAKRPFTIEGNIAKGPGVADMKAGCLYTLYAAEAFEKDQEKTGKIAYFYNAEHEIGCPFTREIIENLCRKSEIVIAAEPARGNGTNIKRRKGILRFTFMFEGISAHAGNNPEDGACAITEMAKWITAIKAMEEPSKGITINTGMVKGGTSVNSIPDSAELRIDIRACEIEDACRMEKKIKDLKPFDNRIKVTVSGGITRPPMVPDERTDKLCTLVENIGKQTGIEVKWASVGGGSDASFASVLGKPVLCGLSPRGQGLHTAAEILYMDDLSQRYDMFKGILKEFSLTKV